MNPFTNSLDEFLSSQKEIRAALIESVKSAGFVVVSGNYNPERPGERPARDFRPDEAPPDAAVRAAIKDELGRYSIGRT